MNRSVSSYPTITLTPEERAWAEKIGVDRNQMGSAPSVDNGKSGDHVHVLGAMAEIAVCRYYGEDYREQIIVLPRRPGAIPDVVHRGWRVSVKATEQWNTPLHLIIPEHDTANDAYMLVCVDVGQATCGLRGWVTRDELLRYPPEEWKWDKTRPGAKRGWRLRRYISVQELRPCRNAAVSAMQAPGATIAAARP